LDDLAWKAALNERKGDARSALDFWSFQLNLATALSFVGLFVTGGAMAIGIGKFGELSPFVCALALSPFFGPLGWACYSGFRHQRAYIEWKIANGHSKDRAEEDYLKEFPPAEPG